MRRKRCACHPVDVYGNTVECPRCHHWSFDDLGTWAGCERRKCGYEVTRPQPLPEQATLGL